MVTSSVEKITPNMAKEMINGSVNCRRLSQKDVKDYAIAMRSGKWKLNGVPIVFDREGKLIDGFHRLSAVKMSGMPIQSMVARGVDCTSVGSIDVGKKRTGGDFLYIMEGEENIKYEKAIATALNIINWYEKNKFLKKRATLSNDDVWEAYKAHDGIMDSVGKAYSNKTSIASSAVIGAFHYLFSKKDPELADTFICQMGDGIAETRSDPFHVLREKLVKNKTARFQMTRESMFRFFIATWNLKRSGRKVKRINYDVGKISMIIK